MACHGDKSQVIEEREKVMTTEAGFKSDDGIIFNSLLQKYLENDVG